MGGTASSRGNVRYATRACSSWGPSTHVCVGVQETNTGWFRSTKVRFRRYDPTSYTSRRPRYLERSGEEETLGNWKALASIDDLQALNNSRLYDRNHAYLTFDLRKGGFRTMLEPSEGIAKRIASGDSRNFYGPRRFLSHCRLSACR